MPEKLKIAFPYSLFLDEERSAGVGTFLNNCASFFAKRGHDVTILTSGEGPDIAAAAGFKIVRLAKVEPFVRNRQYFNPFFILRRLRYMWRLYRYVCKNDIDIVEASDAGFEHLFLLLFSRNKCITCLHANSTDHRDIMFVPLLNFMERMVIKLSPLLISPTISNAEHQSRKYRIPGGRIKTIPNGLDFSAPYKNVDVRSKYGLIGKRIVLFVGSGSFHKKGLDLFIACAARFESSSYDDIMFISIGRIDQPFLLKQLPGNFRVLGFIERDELYSFYSAAEVYINASRFETFGYSTIEAMHCGAFVLVSDCVGSRDVVKAGPGVEFFKSSDLDDLCAKLKDISGQLKKGKKTYQENIDWVKQYDMGAVFQKREELYLQCKNIASGQRQRF